MPTRLRDDAVVPKPLPLASVADLTDGLDGRVLAVSATARGHAVAIVVSHEDWSRATRRVEGSGGATFATTRVDPPYAATFIEHDGREICRQVALDHVPVAFPAVDTLPKGRVLVVGSRCRRHGDGRAERNACVFDGNGTLLRDFTVGDGIEHVQTTSDGAIWVGYFDEGVFGNFGWDEPIGSSGIVVFDAAGAQRWAFEPREGAPDIADCYALNVDDREAWACYYTDFPLVRIADGVMTSWKTELAGLRAFAVGQGRVLAVGGYSARDRVVLAAITDAGRVERLAEYKLRARFREAVVIGRGGTLHVFDGPRWHRMDVADL
jgi:hypothetical protein